MENNSKLLFTGDDWDLFKFRFIQKLHIEGLTDFISNTTTTKTIVKMEKGKIIEQKLSEEQIIKFGQKCLHIFVYALTINILR